VWQLKQTETDAREKCRLKRIGADLTLDKARLQDALSKKF